MAAEKLVYLFNEGTRRMKELLGYKGANLAEMTGLGLPVPFGFTVTTRACEEYHAAGDRLSEALSEEIRERLSILEEVENKRFGAKESPLFVSVRAGEAESAPASFKTILNISNFDDMIAAIEAVFRSGERVAASVQAMVYGNLGENSGAGVAVTRNPQNGRKEILASFNKNAVGRAPLGAGERLLVMNEENGFPAAMTTNIESIAALLEKHYGDMQELEFTFEKGHIYMLQTKRAVRSPRAAIKVAADMAEEGMIKREKALRRVRPEWIGEFSQSEESELLLRWADEYRNIKVYSEAEGHIFDEDENELESVALLRSVKEALNADKAAKDAELLLFDLRSLSEGVFGNGKAPEGTLDPDVGYVLKTAVERAKKAKPSIRTGIYGSYAEDIETMLFLERTASNCIVCPKTHTAAARICAARAAILEEREKRNG